MRSVRDGGKRRKWDREGRLFQVDPRLPAGLGLRFICWGAIVVFVNLAAAFAFIYLLMWGLQHFGVVGTGG